MKVQDVGPEAIERAAAQWSERVSPKTCNKILTTLTAVFSLAKRYKLTKDNPAQEAERSKVRTEEEEGFEITPDQVYSRDEVGRLIQATEAGTVQRPFVMTLALIGLRIREALALSWEAVDLKAGTLRVDYTLADSPKGQEPMFQPPKTKSSRRIIQIPDELLHELKLWKLRCPKSERGLVFATEEGKPLHRKSASKMLDAAIEKANEGADEKAKIKRLTPHGLRHTFASLLLADRTAVTEVSHLLGHKDSYVTLKVYAHFVREETSAVHKLARSILAGGGE
jgi:integrase